MGETNARRGGHHKKTGTGKRESTSLTAPGRLERNLGTSNPSTLPEDHNHPKTIHTSPSDMANCSSMISNVESDNNNENGTNGYENLGSDKQMYEHNEDDQDDDDAKSFLMKVK